jgi:hypothetical protein
MFMLVKYILTMLIAALLSLQTGKIALAQSSSSPAIQEDNVSDEAEEVSDDEPDEDADKETESNVEDEPKTDIQSDNQAETPQESLPAISYDLNALPFPTRRMHELILEATKSGDIEKLRAYIGTGDSKTMLSLGGFDGDPIDYLKQESGDDNGHEILAILEEILQAGYVHLDKGTERELYVWPYFFAYPLDKLSDRQMVELFRIVTYGDLQDMQDFGGYIFYRAGITPTGRWTFFVAGD